MPPPADIYFAIFDPCFYFAADYYAYFTPLRRLMLLPAITTLRFDYLLLFSADDVMMLLHFTMSRR